MGLVVYTFCLTPFNLSWSNLLGHVTESYFWLPGCGAPLAWLPRCAFSDWLLQRLLALNVYPWFLVSSAKAETNMMIRELSAGEKKASMKLGEKENRWQALVIVNKKMIKHSGLWTCFWCWLSNLYWRTHDVSSRYKYCLCFQCMHWRH